MKKYCFILFSLIAFLYSEAQEKLGITNSNYSSTNSIFLNPSSSVDSRTYMQLNLVGANIFAMTNIAYLPKFSFWSLKNTDQLQGIEISSIQLKKYLYALAEVNAPAFVISKRNYGAGFFIRGRSVADAKNIPYELTNFLLNNTATVPTGTDLNLKNVKFSDMTWVEYGLNFGLMLKKERKDLMSVGGNLKYITGINIAYGNLTSLKGMISDTSSRIDELNGKLRFNTPAWNSGKGFGMDLGFTYKKMLSNIDTYYANSKLSNCNYIDYQYKLGVTLRDIGYIRFTKNTSTADFDASGNTGDRSDTAYKTYLDLNFNSTTKTNVPILATLPSALSVQFDYNFGNHFYLNGTLVKNLIPTRWIGAQAANLISVCPRYEFKNFELAMPLTFQRFIYPQLGFAFRVRTFVLGFDNVFPLFIKKNTYGLNVYFSIGISLFKNPACRVKGQRINDCPTNIVLKKEKKKSRKKGKSYKGKKRS